MSDGGPAFPSTQMRIGGNPAYHDGMSLRDYFAGQALTGFLAMCSAAGETQPGPEDAAEHCYRIADAMLAQRNEGRSQSLDVPPLTPYQSSIKIP